MTVGEAIDRSAVLYPAELEGTAPYVYLSEIEGKIKKELLGIGGNVSFSSKDSDTKLSVDGIYAQIYPIYIASRRELAAGDADRYEFLSSVLETLYRDCANQLNREKTPDAAVYIKTV